jgi:hypothetical protein
MLGTLPPGGEDGTRAYPAGRVRALIFAVIGGQDAMWPRATTEGEPFANQVDEVSMSDVSRTLRPFSSTGGVWMPKPRRRAQIPRP